MAAASKLLTKHGLKGMSISAIASQLGGSTTMVTHYYPTIGDLLEDLAARTVAEWQTEVDEIMAAHPDDPRRQLQAVLFEWLTPLTGDTLAKERIRFNLLNNASPDKDTQRLQDTWESGMRSLFRQSVRPLVAEDQVEDVADVLRVTFNGLALSTVEHPDYWTAARQRNVFEAVVTSLGLLEPVRSSSTARAAKRPAGSPTGQSKTTSRRTPARGLKE